MFDALIAALKEFANWLWHGFLDLLIDGLVLIFSAAAYLVENIPPPPQASYFGQAFAAIPCEIWYWLDMFRVPTGIQVLVAAYLVRFLIRRLPFVG
jgi:hypothetical protein